MNSCDHEVTIQSDVHEDGSLDRTIVLHNGDSADATANFLGISHSTGWDVRIEPLAIKREKPDSKPDLDITFKKHFSSVEEANDEMDESANAPFHITSTFARNNRWFYTYIEYRDTYRALNMFDAIPQEEYFTQEDYAFIDRLPAEGRPITRADSLYLARLNEKIMDIYGQRVIFEEFYNHLLETVKEFEVPAMWRDTLSRKKEKIYQRFVQETSNENGDFIGIVDHLKIPLPPAARETIAQHAAQMEKRLELMSDAYTGTYIHSIKLPWTIVSSNADSVINNELFWRPPVVKFLLSDYTMTATSRKMNVWSVVVSAFVVFATVGLLAWTRTPHLRLRR
jgi:hypothetical protein